MPTATAPDIGRRLIRQLMTPGSDQLDSADLAQVRARGDFFQLTRDLHVSATYEGCKAVLRHPAMLVEGADQLDELGVSWRESPAGRQIVNELVLLEGEAHRVIRELVLRPFQAPRKVATRSIVTEVAAQQVRCVGQALARGESCDALEHFVRAVPLRVICRLLGLSAEVGAQLATHMAPLSVFLSASFETGRTRDEADAAVEALAEIMTPALRARASEPADDLLGDLVTLRHERPDLVDDTRLLANALLLHAAGYETTVSHLAACLVRLGSDRTTLATLRADPSRVVPFLREMERLAPPIQQTVRVAAEDVQIRGTLLPAGCRVVVLIDGANRDPALRPGSDPEQLDLQAPPVPSLAFGAGRHLCAGISLARWESEAAIRGLVEHWPDFVSHADGSRFELSNPHAHLTVRPARDGAPPPFGNPIAEVHLSAETERGGDRHEFRS
ncbi:MAG: cytochrome P450 [Terracoccus sp.]